MPLFDIPVMMPYRIDGDESGTLYPVQVRAVASGTPAAIATAEVLVDALARLHHPGQTIQVLKSRAKVGTSGRTVEGPYAYVLTRGCHIHHVDFPSRIDNQAGELLHETLAALDDPNTWALVIDCAPLTFINTTGLTTLSAHTARVRLFRVPPTIAKVFAIVGLDRIMRCESSLTSALATLVQENADADPPLPAVP